MIYQNLIYSALCGLASFGYYKIYKGWSKSVDKNPLFSEPNIIVSKIKDWIIIIGFAIASIVFLLKSM